MIDNTLSHDTPEGIRLSLVPAGIVVRAWAFLIDFMALFKNYIYLNLPFHLANNKLSEFSIIFVHLE